MIEYLWIPIVGSLVTFYTAWGGGANDCANSFASAVGSKAITLKSAVYIASIFEFAGAFLMGSHVTDTIRKNILEIDLFVDNPEKVMFGMFCSCLAAGIWLTIATYYKWPVSTTHTTIGAICGFGLAAEGIAGINWGIIVKIVVSWFLSPLLSGLITVGLFKIIRNCILRKDNSYKLILYYFPVIISFATTIYSFFIIYKGTPALGLKDTSLRTGIMWSLVIGVFSGIVVQLFYIPIVKRKANSEVLSIVSAGSGSGSGSGSSSGSRSSSGSGEGNTIVAISNDNSPTSSVSDSDESTKLSKQDRVNILRQQLKTAETENSEEKIDNLHSNAEFFTDKTEKVCSSLQVFTACFDSFAHGSNDVANAIGPYAAIIAIYESGVVTEESNVPLWILAIGGIGIVFGLATWGYKVIDRIGREMTKITPSRGCCIELGSTTAVVIASRLKIPVSTTHCQVGSVMACGMVDGWKNVNMNVFAKIFLGWVFTLPVAGAFSALLFLFGYYSPSN